MTDNDVFAEIQAEGYNSQLGAQDVSLPNKKFPPRYVYKVANRNPRSKGVFEPGIVMVTQDTDANGDKVSTQEVVQSVRCVFLYTQDCRSYFGKDGLKCCSDDGLFPADRIADKICHKLNADGVAAVLSKFKGYDEARISLVTQELTQDTGKLCQCSIKARNGFIPICPAARGSETMDGRYVPPSCKQQVFVAAYDIERKRVFNMNLSGKSIQSNAKFVSPYHEFRAFVSEKRVPFFALTVTISAKEDGEFYLLGVDKISPIAQRENREAMCALAEEELAKYVKRSCKQKETPVVEKIVADTPVKEEVVEEVAEDDIPF